MVAFIYIMIYNIKRTINYIKKQRNETMKNSKSSFTIKCMKLGTKESIFIPRLREVHRGHGGKNGVSELQRGPPP